MTRTLYVMRHGETEDNVSQTITAQADSPLTERGREQAHAKGITLRKLGIDLNALAFVASPLHRACVTMELMRTGAGLAALPYSTDPRLMEMSFGDWTKQPEGSDRYAPGQPSAHEQWDLQPPGGESQAMVFARVGAFLASASQDSVIVCHARVLCMIRGHVLGLAPDQIMRFEPPNAGLVLFVDGRERWIET